MRKQSEDNEMTRILIGVTGGSAAGKTTLCENIKKLMAIDGDFRVLIIPLDAFYKSVDKERVKIEEYNFDRPQALDFDMAYKVLTDLMRGQKTQLPKYCFVTHQRLKEVEEVEPSEIIMFEGIMALYDPRIRDLMKYKIFIHCDNDIRLCRRIVRDVSERGRTVEGVLHQYYQFVKDAYKDYIYPTIRYADLIVPGSRNNKVSVEFIVRHMKNMTREIQFYRRAINTKIYFYGEVLENFLRNESSQDSLISEVSTNMEFLFACAEEHKKELDLFIGQLLSEVFTQQYFKNIFVNQFVRLLCDFLQTVTITILKRRFEEIEVLLNDTLGEQQFKVEGKRLCVLFVPYLCTENLNKVKEVREKLNPDCHLVILTIFCYHVVLKKLLRLKRCVLVNLFCIANENRFKEVLQANLRDETTSAERLLSSTKLIHKAETKIKQFVERRINNEED